MPAGIDHTIILVDDLDQGIQAYKDLGFTVSAGGKHPRFTHNGLITFADGTYIELIAFYDMPDSAEQGVGHRWVRHVGHDKGIIDYALAEPDLDAAVERENWTHGAIYPGGRNRLDGVELVWRSSMAKDSPNVGALPFVIQDVTDRELRVPSADAHHNNGVTGTKSITVAVADLDAASERYSRFLGVSKPDGAAGETYENAEGVSFKVGAQRIDVVAPTGPGAIKDFVDAHGDGPFEVVLISDNPKEIDPAAANHARIKLVSG